MRQDTSHILTGVHQHLGYSGAFSICTSRALLQAMATAPEIKVHPQMEFVLATLEGVGKFSSLLAMHLFKPCIVVPCPDTASG